MTTSTELDTREERAWLGYRRMQTELTRRIRRELTRDTGLSDADYDVMQALSDEPDSAMRARELRAALHWEKSRLSHHIARMERRGLVVRQECDEDSRGSVVRLTDAGAAAIGAACAEHTRAIRALLIDRLSPDQLDALTDISETVLAALDDDFR